MTFFQRTSAFRRRPGHQTALVALLVSLSLFPACKGRDGEREAVPEAVPEALGKVDFQVSCSPEAQAQFDEAALLLHHMTYPKARGAFRAVLESDPDCAMAHWGVAMSLFQPLWPTRPSPADLQLGWDEVQLAKSKGTPTERESLFIATAEAFFEEPTGTDYWLRIRRWEKAMDELYTAFPMDHEATTFYALSHLAGAPADAASSSRSSRAAELLLDVYAKNAEHPGAMHYIIHANDTPGRESELLDIVHKYETVAPNNPHALHMPTHIYTRLGDWDGVVRGNIRAAEAALLHPAGANGELVSDEFPHAIEYLVYAHLQSGADGEAEAQLRRLQGTKNVQPSFKTAFHWASTEARYALERQQWQEAAEIVPRAGPDLDWDRFKWPEAISWFARGLGAAHVGQIDEAREATEQITRLGTAAEANGEPLNARNIAILETEMRAWVTFREGNSDSAISLLEEAAALEASTPKSPVTPGPILPALEQLGAMLLEDGRAGEALRVFEQTLNHYPGRFNSIVGAARAARKADDADSAKMHFQALLGMAAEDARPSVLNEAREFLGEEVGSADSELSEPETGQ